MNQRIPRILAACSAIAWAGLSWLSDRGTDASSPRPTPVPGLAGEKHYVTPAQLAESGSWGNRQVGAFSAVAHDGKPFAWSGKSQARPLVLVFIRQGCPCNGDLEPFFQRLAGQYGDVADFAGVIDAGADTARAYAMGQKTPYRVLADPDRALIARFQARNGGYIALLRPEGCVDTLWPGYSAEMMRELGRRIAELGAIPERPLDVAGLPGALTTGCPFEL
jgi:hypothetical protein